MLQGANGESNRDRQTKTVLCRISGMVRSRWCGESGWHVFEYRGKRRKLGNRLSAGTRESVESVLPREREVFSCEIFVNIPLCGARGTGKELEGLLHTERVKGGKNKSFLLGTFDGQTDSVFGKSLCRSGCPSKKCHVFRVVRFLWLMPTCNGLFALKIYHPLTIFWIDPVMMFTMFIGYSARSRRPAIYYAWTDLSDEFHRAFSFVKRCFILRIKLEYLFIVR